MTRFYRDPIEMARAVEAATKRSFVAGVDLGTARDFTAISVLEVIEAPIVELNKLVPRVPDYEIRYDLRYVERLPLGQDYLAIVQQISTIVNTAPIRGCTLAVDYSGVGRPVFTMLQEAGLRPIGIQITGGGAWTREGQGFNVAKSFLMSNLLKLINKRQLHIPADLPDLDLLRAELQDLRTTTSAAGYTRVSAAEGRHDDLALSLAVAAFAAVHRPKPAVVGKFVTGG